MPLLTQLNILESSGLVRLAAVQPELEYLFRHALLQDAAYSSLLKSQRKRLHRSVGETLEQLYPDRLDELASTLALHFEQAEELDKAIHYFIRAGDRAKASYANHEAIKFYQSALAHLADTSSQPEALVPLWERAGELLELIGQREVAREHFAQALQLLTQSAPEDCLSQARLHRKIATSLATNRLYAQAVQRFEQAEQLLQTTPAETHEWRQELLQNYLDRLWMHYSQNQPDVVAAIIEKTRPWLEKYGSPEQKSRFSWGLTQNNFRRNRFRITAEDIARRRADLANCEASGNPNLQVEAYFALGFVLLWHGAWDEAEERLQAAIKLAERIGHITTHARALAYLLVLHRMRKNAAAVEAQMPRALEIFTAGQMLEYVPYIKACAAWLAWRAGNLEAAQQQAQAALDLWSKAPNSIPFHWIAHWLLLDIALRQQQIPKAIEHANAMLAPSQQKLPDDLIAALEAAVQGGIESAREPLEAAIRLASEKGYL